MKIENFKDKGKTFIIAEIGQAHDGSLGMLYSLLESASSIGVNAVKFQIHIADAESSKKEPFRVNFSYQDSTRYDYWKRMEFSEKDWHNIKKKCDELKVEFLATPFSLEAVNLLEKLNVKRYKIGSGDASNMLLLEKIAKTKKEVIISTGLGTIQELISSTSMLKNKKIPYTILQCTTKYPTSAKDIGLEWLKIFEKKFSCPVGLSDHSGTIYPCLGAVTLGAAVIEAHITFDKRMFGPDSSASLSINQFSELVRGVRFLEIARGLGEDNKKINNKKELRRIFGRALACNKDLNVGHTITFDDLEVKKPSDAGIPVDQYREVIGMKVINKKSAWDFLNYKDLKKSNK